MRFEYDIASLLFVPTLTRIVPAGRIRRIYQGLIHPSAWKRNSPKFGCTILHRSSLRGTRMASEGLRAA
jgi:hypothetical protein